MERSSSALSDELLNSLREDSGVAGNKRQSVPLAQSMPAGSSKKRKMAQNSSTHPDAVEFSFGSPASSTASSKLPDVSAISEIGTACREVLEASLSTNSPPPHSLVPTTLSTHFLSPQPGISVPGGPSSASRMPFLHRPQPVPSLASFSVQGLLGISDAGPPLCPAPTSQPFQSLVGVPGTDSRFPPAIMYPYPPQPQSCCAQAVSMLQPTLQAILERITALEEKFSTPALPSRPVVQEDITDVQRQPLMDESNYNLLLPRSEIAAIQDHSNSRSNLATNLVRQLFSQQELKNSNVTGRSQSGQEKRALSPARMRWIRDTVNQRYPPGTNETE